MRTRRLAAALLVAGVVLTGCAGGTKGAQDVRPDDELSVAPSEPSAPDAFRVPREVDERAWCGGLDDVTVTDLLGVPIVRRSTVRPGDPVAQPPGARARYYRCDFGTEPAADELGRGLAVSFNPASSGTAGDARRSLEGEPALDGAGCGFDDLAGVDTERGYVQVCAGSEPTDAGGSYVAAGTAVRVDVGEGHLYCQEYSAPSAPSGIGSAAVVTACQELFGQLAG